MLSSEVEKLGGFAGSAISGPLFSVGTLVFVLGYMFWVEPLVATIALALYSPQLIIVPIFQARMNRLSQQKALKLRALGSYSQITDARMRYATLLGAFLEDHIDSGGMLKL